MIHDYGARVHGRRTQLLYADYPRPDELRELAGAIKQHMLENLDRYLEHAEARLHDRGAKVHWARTGEEADEIVLGLMRRYGAKRMVKSKSMLTEETELLPFLERHGVEVIET